MPTWSVKAIDVMHLSKDTMRGQLTQTQINTVVNNLAKFNVTHVALSCPLDEAEDYVDPAPTAGYLEMWVEAIRTAKLKVWYRQTWLDFEGLYDTIRATPTGTPARPLGIAASVLDGSDTTSYLYKTWDYIKTHGSLFEEGDIWAPFPEPENQGVGSGTSDMFSSHDVLGQFLVDLKSISDDAFETHLLFRHNQILTGMTSINGGTVETNQVGSSYWTQIGRIAIDHYIPIDNYSSSLDTISTNSGGVDMYIGEWGTTGGSGEPETDAERAENIQTVFTTFASKSYLKGVSYWQAVGGVGDAPEAILDDSTYEPKALSYNTILSFFTDREPSQISRFVTRLGNQFRYRGARFRFIGFNAYTLVIQNSSIATISALFDAARQHGVTVFRTWCFDSGHPPINAAGNFRYLTTAALGSNILPNGDFETNTTGWTLDGNFTRSTLDSHSGTASVAQSSAGGFQNFTTVNDSTGLAVTANTYYTLKFWYKLSVTGNAPNVWVTSGSAYGTPLGSSILGGTAGGWVQGSIGFNTGSNTKVWIRIFNNNGTVSGFYDQFELTTGGNPILAWRESQLVQLDTVLNEAKKRGIKMILSLADNNMYFGGYETKITYFNWANSIYNAGLVNTENYFEFFRSEYCRILYREFIAGLVNRVNTINGELYRNDPTIMSWELGNEMRIDQSAGDTNVDTVNSRNVQLMAEWADTMSTYIKSIDPNHLVDFSSGAHGYGRSFDPGGSGRQDWVWNGSYYGVDYNTLMGLENIDFVSCHSYPNQGLGSSDIRDFGYRFGYTYAQRTEGYRAQLRDYIAKAKANGKPLVLGEIGYAREDTGTMEGWPMYPRIYAFNNVFKEIFENDGDGICIWSATTQGGGSFSVGLGEVGTASYWGSNENKNDSLLMQRINGLNTTLVSPGSRARAV